MSFPALAIAAAAVAEVTRYTGVAPAFLVGLEVSFSHMGRDGEPVWAAHAEAVIFGYLHMAEDGSPVGIHDRPCAP